MCQESPTREGALMSSRVLTFLSLFALLFLAVAPAANRAGASTAPAAEATKSLSSAPIDPQDESKVPHYFGPYQNWANSPFTLPDVAVEIVGDGVGRHGHSVRWRRRRLDRHHDHRSRYRLLDRHRQHHGRRDRRRCHGGRHDVRRCHRHHRRCRRYRLHRPHRLHFRRRRDWHAGERRQRAHRAT